MKQSKRMSLLETTLSTAIGFGISLAAQIFFLPLLGVEISLHQNFVFAVIMTVISIARGFALRRLFEALQIRRPIPASILAIAAERQRQIDVEGWTSDHDAGHRSGELAQAAASYCLGAGFVAAYDIHTDDEFLVTGRELWPWTPDWWKPCDRRRNWIRAGALIAAELDKLDRDRKRRAA